ncbi:MAG TPA: hypothetical protein VNV39_06600 [Stellaceae bacterium]|nr:hypothetical protein [Stellaceae bacterium]
MKLAAIEDMAVAAARAREAGPTPVGRLTRLRFRCGVGVRGRERQRACAAFQIANRVFEPAANFQSSATVKFQPARFAHLPRIISGIRVEVCLHISSIDIVTNFIARHDFRRIEEEPTDRPRVAG